jgi:hypothetical protein
MGIRRREVFLFETVRFGFQYAANIMGVDAEKVVRFWIVLGILSLMALATLKLR